MMRRLDYDNPGSLQDLKVFKVNLEAKSKSELILMIGNVAAACDMEGKGYVSEWENSVRHAIGYTRGNGIDHEDTCGCPRCQEEKVGAYKQRGGR